MVSVLYCAGNQQLYSMGSTLSQDRVKGVLQFFQVNTCIKLSVLVCHYENSMPQLDPACRKHYFQTRILQFWSESRQWLGPCTELRSLAHYTGDPAKAATLALTPGRDRLKAHFCALPSQHACRLFSACLIFVCTACTEITVHVKDSMSFIWWEKAQWLVAWKHT